METVETVKTVKTVETVETGINQATEAKGRGQVALFFPNFKPPWRLFSVSRCCFQKIAVMSGLLDLTSMCFTQMAGLKKTWTLSVKKVQVF